MLQRSRSLWGNGMTIRHSGARVVWWSRKTIVGADGILASLRLSSLGLTSRRESQPQASTPDCYLRFSRA